MSNELKNVMTNFLQMQNPSSSGSLPSNNIANPRGDMKVITTRSGAAYDGLTIPPTPSPLPKEVERETKATKDKVQTTSLQSTAHVQPTVVQIPIPEPEVAPKLNPKPSIPYPSRLNNQKLREKANNQMLKFLQIFQKLHFDISFADALLHMPKFASICKKLGDPGKFLIPCDFSELDECLALADLGASTQLLNASFPRRFPFGKRSKLVFIVFPFPSELMIATTLSGGKLIFEELKTIKSSIDDPPELELKDLPSHLEHAFLEGNDKLLVIISKELKDEEKAALLKVLKSHKRAIVWKISDIKGIDPRFCTHKILMEDNFKPAVQHQRRLIPKIHEVIKRIYQTLDAIYYPISDSLWVSPVHCVPKMGGMTVVENEDNELIPTRLVT
ncbi:hypothetical protein Tco_0472572 [Tanacetum coccineum]